MKSSGKKTLLISSLLTLFLATQALALPIAGDDSVRMEIGSNVPYLMIDLNDGNREYESFCLEISQYFTPSTTYDVTSVGDWVEGGGIAGGSPDELSLDTKWLYAAYMSDVFVSVSGAAQTVQDAIWYLEEEITDSSAWDILKTYSFDDTGWEVAAVNISLNGVDNQSQLVGTSIPEPPGMLLLGTSVAGLIGCGIRRKKK